MIAMISMVVKSCDNPSHLVQENYYDKDLQYESFRQKRVNASNLNPGITIKYQKVNDAIEVLFPEGMEKVTGTASLFRASNKDEDKSFEIQLDSDRRMSIPFDNSALKGLWKVKVDWENQGRAYYHEEDINIK